MNELTLVLNVQITVVDKLTDEELEEYEIHKDKLLKNAFDAMKEEFELDDILLLDRKEFVIEQDGE